MEWLFFAVIAGLALASAGTSAYGVKVQSDAQQDAANYNALIEQTNAKTAAEQAMFDAEQTRTKNKRLLGAQRAAFSASGIDPDSSTAVDVQDDSSAQGEMEALLSIYTGASSATASTAQARLNRLQGQHARQAGQIGMASSLLSSGSTIASAYPSFR